MEISRIILISNILTDLSAIIQNARIENTFPDIVYNALVVKKS